MLHTPGAGDPLPGEVTLAASAAVQHDGAFPAGRRQVVPQGLRRPGGSGAVPGAVKGQPIPLDADGAPAALSALAAVVWQLAQGLSAYDQGRAGDVVAGAVRQRVHADVRPGVPCVTRNGVGGGRQHLVISLEVAVDGHGAHIVEGAVQAVIRAGLPHDLRQSPSPAVDVDFDAGDSGKRHRQGAEITH